MDLLVNGISGMAMYSFFHRDAFLFGIGFYCVIPLLVVSDLLFRLPDEDFTVFFGPDFGVAHERTAVKHIVGFLVDGLLQGEVFGRHETGNASHPFGVVLDLSADVTLCPVVVVEQSGIADRRYVFASDFGEVGLRVFPQQVQCVVFQFDAVERVGIVPGDGVVGGLVVEEAVNQLLLALTESLIADTELDDGVFGEAFSGSVHLAAA